MVRATTRLSVCLATFSFVVAQAATAIAQVSGEELYARRCAACHDKDVPRAPRLDALRLMSPEVILASLQGGTMQAQAFGLTLAEKQAIAVHVAGKGFGSGPAATTGRCGANAQAFTTSGPEWAGWGAGPENARYQQQPGITPPDLARLKVRWAFGFPGSVLAYGAPAVAGGRVFVGSAGGEVYALDARTGCIHWSHTVEASVRAAPSLGRLKNGRTAVYFGDQSARLYALDAASGTRLWQTIVDDQIAAIITGAPKLHDGRLFVPISVLEDVMTPDPKYPCCRSRGALAAVDAETGRVLWKVHTVAELPGKVGVSAAGTDRWGPSGASIWGSPTIDAVRGAVYVGTGNNHSNPPTDTSDAVLAFEMATGRLLWKRQLTPGGDAWNIACGMKGPNCPDNPGPDHDVGASTILRTLSGGRRVLIAGAKSSKIHALDPDKNGEVLWVQQIGRGGALGGIEWGMAADDTTVYVPLSDLSFGTDMMAGKPSPQTGGGLFAYRFSDGTRRWETPPIPCGDRLGCSPAQSQAATAIPGTVFSGTIGGLLRAYSTDDGRVLWEFDTVRDFETVNGVKARGGTLNGAGPVVAGGMVLVGSGYGRFGQLPGNVLILPVGGWTVKRSRIISGSKLQIGQVKRDLAVENKKPSVAMGARHGPTGSPCPFPEGQRVRFSRQDSGSIYPGEPYEVSGPLRNRMLTPVLDVGAQDLPKKHHEMWKPTQCLPLKVRQPRKAVSYPFQQRELSIAFALEFSVSVQEVPESDIPRRSLSGTQPAVLPIAKFEDHREDRDQVDCALRVLDGAPED